MKNVLSSISRIQKILIGIILLLVLVTVYFINIIYGSNTNKDYSLYVRTGASFQEVLDSLQRNQVLNNQRNFEIVSKLLKYSQLVKPGHYVVKKGMSNMVLVKKLRAGNQDPVWVRFESKRTLQEIAHVIASNLELTENQLLEACLASDFLQRHGLTRETVISIFIPNTYRVYWNIKPERLLEFFVNEYKKFFVKHQDQLEKLGMTAIQISTLASIVEAETYQDSEKKRIAGVYYNRLKQNMRLQADPTVIFAIGDFTKTRVLRSDLEIDSPYNTYKIKGLPIGPINAPGIASLEAALYPENHHYIFFCAKPDFSGYHDFSSDYNDHLKQSRAYHEALNRLKIVK